MPLARIRAVAAAGEPLAVEINGSPLPVVVRGLSVQMVDGIPQFVLAASGEGVIEGEGLVVVERTTEGDAQAELLALIDSLDPAELDRKACEHAPTLASKPGEGYIAALREIVAGTS